MFPHQGVSVNILELDFCFIDVNYQNEEIREIVVMYNEELGCNSLSACAANCWWILPLASID